MGKVYNPVFSGTLAAFQPVGQSLTWSVYDDVMWYIAGICRLRGSWGTFLYPIREGERGWYDVGAAYAYPLVPPAEHRA